MTYPYVAGAVLLASDLNTDFAAKTDLAMVQNAQTGSSYSYTLLDASKLLTMNNASANTVTVTKQATVTWVTGTQLRIMNLGAGVTTLVADTGVTITNNVALKQYQGGTLIRTASDVWLFVPTASSSGMDLIIPTSVVGTGVTLSGGQVTFSAASSASVNGCFTSSYETYLVVASFTNSIQADNRVRLRVSGTDSSANYNFRLALLQSAYGTSTASSEVPLGSGFGELGVYTLTISGPFNAAATSIYSAGNDGNATSLYASGGVHSLSTSYDGFSLLCNTGTITGTLRVYGLRNS